MSPGAKTLEIQGTRAPGRAGDFLRLTKPRVVLFVLATVLVGFYLGSQGGTDWLLLVRTLMGTALAAGGTVALNQYLEREVDGQMRRTRLRPLPDGRMKPGEALAFGLAITVAGLLYLTVAVHALCALITAITVVGYIFVYTPLKRKTSLCSLAGAIPGALPPVAGWVASRGEMGPEAWVLFGILFLWQLPHSLAIAWIYREDYARAGIRLLPVVSPDGWSTGRQVVASCLALLAVGLLPTLMGLTGALYFMVALALGGVFLGCGIGLACCRSAVAAQRLLWASLLYLPVLLIFMALDKVPS